MIMPAHVTEWIKLRRLEFRENRIHNIPLPKEFIVSQQMYDELIKYRGFLDMAIPDINLKELPLTFRKIPIVVK